VIPTRRLIFGLLAGLALLGLGCREELGPEYMPTTRVVGRVHIRSTPVGGGWIEFFPVEGTIGKLRTARIRPDGTFVADRVSLGRNAIQIAHARMPPPFWPVFERAAIIRRDIVNVPETSIDIDLQDEYLALLRSQPHGP
jgi:hypothetical protein